MAEKKESKINVLDFNTLCQIAQFVPEELCTGCGQWKFQPRGCPCMKTLILYHPMDDLYDLGIDLPNQYVWNFIKCGRCRQDLPLSPITTIINMSVRYCKKCKQYQ